MRGRESYPAPAHGAGTSTQREEVIRLAQPKKTVYRDSKDGQFVKKEYADKHPATTEKERVRTGDNKKGK